MPTHIGREHIRHRRAASIGDKAASTRTRMLRNSPNDWPMRGRRLAFCNETGGFVMAFSDNSSISATAARWRHRCRLPASSVNGSRRTEGTRKNSPCSIASAISLRSGFGPVHEAIRDLVRARMDAVRARQQCEGHYPWDLGPSSIYLHIPQ